MGDESVQLIARLQHAIQSGVVDLSCLLQDDDLLNLAERLARSDLIRKGDLGPRIALGWWHFLRSKAFGHTVVGRDELRRAEDLLRPVFIERPEAIPAQILHLLEARNDRLRRSGRQLLQRYSDGDPAVSHDRVMLVLTITLEDLPLSSEGRVEVEFNIGSAEAVRYRRSGNTRSARIARDYFRRVICRLPVEHPAFDVTVDALFSLLLYEGNGASAKDAAEVVSLRRQSVDASLDSDSARQVRRIEALETAMSFTTAKAHETSLQEESAHGVKDTPGRNSTSREFSISGDEFPSSAKDRPRIPEVSLSQWIADCLTGIEDGGQPEVRLRRMTHAAGLAHEGFRAYGDTEYLGVELGLLRRMLSIQTQEGLQEDLKDRLAAGLIVRYIADGAVSDLYEGLEFQSDLLRARRLRGIVEPMFVLAHCEALLLRFDLLRNLDDVEVALSEANQADNSSVSVVLSASLKSLRAQALCLRYEAGVGGDLSDATKLAGEAVRMLIAEGAPYSGALMNLGNVLQTVAKSEGSIAAWKRAVRTLRGAAALTPRSGDERARRLLNLGGALAELYSRTLDKSQIDEAVEALSEALPMTQPTSITNIDCAQNLSAALSARFEQSRSPEDLDAAISHAATSLSFLPAGPRAAEIASNVSNLLLKRFEQSGSLPYLDTAINTARDAMNKFELEDKRRAGVGGTLGSLLRRRFERTKASGDIEESIALHERGVAVSSARSDALPMELSNLSLALRSRYAVEHRRRDVIRAMRVSRKAVRLTARDSAQRSIRVVNFAAALFDNYTRSRSVRYLDEGIRLLRSALPSISLDDPSRIACLNNLGLLFETRHSRRLTAADLKEARDLFREVASSPLAQPRAACLAALAWGRLTNGEDTVDAFRRALDLLPSVGAPWLSVNDSAHEFRGIGSLGREAAAALIEAGHIEEALGAVELARASAFARLLTQRSELSGLDLENPKLAGRVRKALLTLNSNSAATPIYPLRDSAHPVNELTARLAADRDLQEVLRSIRAKPKWKHFMERPTAGDAQELAQGGPIVVINVAKARCDAIIVSADSVRLVELPDLNENDVNKWTAEFLAGSQILSSERVYFRDRDREQSKAVQVLALTWLWKTTMKPILDSLECGPRGDESDYESWPRVWWIPTGALCLLPLHAAADYKESPDWFSAQSDGRPAGAVIADGVIDRVVSSTVPTFSALSTSRERQSRDPERQARCLIVAMPTTPGHADLPATEEEVDALVRVLGANFTKVLAEFGDRHSPSKSDVLSQLGDYEWVHFACHALTDPTEPMNSALLLADHEFDPFEVRDLVDLHTGKATLIFLSACSTAKTALHEPDEPLHFSGAAMLAGYRHAIATLWPIDDDAEPAALIYTYLDPRSRNDWSANTAAFAVHAAVRHRRKENPRNVHRWAAHVHAGP